ncbi:MAG: cation-translocating P-type ATPase [Gaiella sp.]
MAAPHAQPVSEVIRAVDSDSEAGLTTPEAARRLLAAGPNELEATPPPDLLAIALRQFADPIVALLALAVVVATVIGDGIEAVVIMCILVVNAAIGFLHELGAERAVRELRERLAPAAEVVRDGSVREIPAREVVPGDILVVREGSRVVADGRIVEARGVMTDESALTGESLPVTKFPEPVAEEAALGDRVSMVFAGTSVTRGRARVVVTATGQTTELGLISALVAHARSPKTPLQVRLSALSRWLAALGLVVTLALAALMLARGETLHDAFLVGVAVAVAAVPEGLPATITVALALGARAMARRGAIVRRLSAIETIGEATVICTDKTGTLTENSLRLAALRPADGVAEGALLVAALRASSPDLAEPAATEDRTIDPLERAILLGALDRGLTAADAYTGCRLRHEIPFDPEHRMMTVVYGEADGSRAYVKGAPERLFDLASPGPEAGLLEAAAAWAEEGLRVLAVGVREGIDDAAPRWDDQASPLRLAGLVALHDPLRATAPGAVAEAKRAGVEVVMITGDHPRTAHTIGRAVGLRSDEVHARVSPAEKLEIVRRYQQDGGVVVVTGDGVNDAPALRTSDVGIAMGRSGTETAREAADIVLTDDDFSTLVAALEEGRRIGANIRKFVAFLLSANLAEVAVFTVAIAAGLGAPLTVVQVLLVNVLTDGLPAVALARDPILPEQLTARPRRGGALLERRQLAILGGIGLLVAGVTLIAFLAGREGDAARGQTMAFMTLALAELALVFGCRSFTHAAWRLPVNPYLLSGVALSAVIVALAVFTAPGRSVIGGARITADEVGLCLGLALLPLVAFELQKAFRRRRPPLR